MKADRFTSCYSISSICISGISSPAKNLRVALPPVDTWLTSDSDTPALFIASTLQQQQFQSHQTLSAQQHHCCQGFYLSYRYAWWMPNDYIQIIKKSYKMIEEYCRSFQCCFHATFESCLYALYVLLYIFINNKSFRVMSCYSIHCQIQSPCMHT